MLLSECKRREQKWFIVSRSSSVKKRISKYHDHNILPRRRYFAKEQASDNKGSLDTREEGISRLCCATPRLNGYFVFPHSCPGNVWGHTTNDIWRRQTGAATIAEWTRRIKMMLATRMINCHSSSREPSKHAVLIVEFSFVLMSQRITVFLELIDGQRRRGIRRMRLGRIIIGWEWLDGIRFTIWQS